MAKLIEVNQPKEYSVVIELSSNELKAIKAAIGKSEGNDLKIYYDNQAGRNLDGYPLGSTVKWSSGDSRRLNDFLSKTLKDNERGR